MKGLKVNSELYIFGQRIFSQDSERYYSKIYQIQINLYVFKFCEMFHKEPSPTSISFLVNNFFSGYFKLKTCWIYITKASPWIHFSPPRFYIPATFESSEVALIVMICEKDEFVRINTSNFPNIFPCKALPKWPKKN